jgi:hypothetical protein
MTDLLLARDAAVLLLSNCNERLGRVFVVEVSATIDFDGRLTVLESSMT